MGKLPAAGVLRRGLLSLPLQQPHHRLCFPPFGRVELSTAGHCSGMENYARHLAGRAPGEAPATLLDYMPPDWLLLVDESHITESLTAPQSEQASLASQPTD